VILRSTESGSLDRDRVSSSDDTAGGAEAGNVLITRLDRLGRSVWSLPVVCSGQDYFRTLLVR